MPKERQQHLERAQIELTDQHGRIWLASSEVGLDAQRRPRIVPVGQFFPQFTAPFDFYPDAMYLVFDPRRPSSLTINYAAWQSAQEARHRETREYMANLAWLIYKDEAPRYIQEPSAEMLEIVYGRGRGPEPVEPIMAARQGNGWVLGLRPFDPTLPGDVRLQPYLEKWVAARYRDVAVRVGSNELDFTEGQAGDAAGDFGMTLTDEPAAGSNALGSHEFVDDEPEMIETPEV